MSYMNLSIIAWSLLGFCFYVYAMSALGRWLAECTERTTTIALRPAGGHETLGA